MRGEKERARERERERVIETRVSECAMSINMSKRSANGYVTHTHTQLGR